MQIDVEVNNGWDFPSHPTNTIKRRIHMLATILQTLLKLSVILGFVFMIACTVFVIVCIAHGDIKINIVKSNAEKGN